MSLFIELESSSEFDFFIHETEFTLLTYVKLLAVTI